MKKTAQFDRTQSLLFMGARAITANAAEKVRPLEDEVANLQARVAAIRGSADSHWQASLAELHAAHGFKGDFSWSIEDGLVTVTWDEPDPPAAATPAPTPDPLKPAPVAASVPDAT